MKAIQICLKIYVVLALCIIYFGVFFGGNGILG